VKKSKSEVVQEQHLEYLYKIGNIPAEDIISVGGYREASCAGFTREKVHSYRQIQGSKIHINWCYSNPK